MSKTNKHEKSSELTVDVRALLDDLFSAGTLVVNEDIADDPEFKKKIFDRLRSTGNNDRADISRGFEIPNRNDETLDDLINQMVPPHLLK